MATRFSYPVNISVDEAGFFLVKFPDLQGTATDGKTREEALVEAVDCLETALAFRMKEKMPIPQPSAARGRPVVSPGALISAKAALYLAWQETGMSCLALSKKLGLPLIILQRMLDHRHRTHIGSIESVLKTLGSHLVVDVSKAA